LGIDFGALSPAQRRSQVALVQLTEQEPVQVMWQVAFPLHDTLPLAPTVVVQVELPVQSTLHESRQVPEQSVWFSQANEQPLPPSAPHRSGLSAQLIPELQEQLPPLHDAGGVLAPPQPRTPSRSASNNVEVDLMSPRAVSRPRRLIA
jgi:hypothetical protein